MASAEKISTQEDSPGRIPTHRGYRWVLGAGGKGPRCRGDASFRPSPPGGQESSVPSAISTPPLEGPPTPSLPRHPLECRSVIRVASAERPIRARTRSLPRDPSIPRSQRHEIPASQDPSTPRPQRPRPKRTEPERPLRSRPPSKCPREPPCSRARGPGSPPAPQPAPLRAPELSNPGSSSPRDRPQVPENGRSRRPGRAARGASPGLARSGSGSCPKEADSRVPSRARRCTRGQGGWRIWRGSRPHGTRAGCLRIDVSRCPFQTRKTSFRGSAAPKTCRRARFSTETLAEQALGTPTVIRDHPATPCLPSAP